MKKLSLLTLLLLMMGQLTFANANSTEKPLPGLMKFSPPAIAFTINFKEDVLLFVDIPCAGEFVILEGPLHGLIHVTINGQNTVSKSHFQPQGISGTGSISGEKYQATGVTQDISKSSSQNGQFTATFINNFRIIGQGSGNNYLVHTTVHVTYNANGLLTSEVGNTTIECK